MALHHRRPLPVSDHGDGRPGIGGRRVRAVHDSPGGALRWGSRKLVLQPASAWCERYALAEGDRELALFDGKSWGRRL